MVKKSRELYDRLLDTCQWRSYPRTSPLSVSEPTVKSAVQTFFEERGFRVDLSPERGQGGYDIVCYHEQQRRWWIIEAKGSGKVPFVDFPQCMGQLLLSMHHSQGIRVSFGIAVPDAKYYTLRYAAIPEAVLSCLQWHWFFVSPQGQARVEEPPGCQCFKALTPS